MATSRTPAVDRRRQILDAAVRAFARRGYEATRVGDVAAEAGVAYGLVYHYFRSKEELLETIFRDTWTQMLATIHEIEEDAEGEPVREQLRKIVALVLRSWNRDPDVVRVLVREVTRTPHLQREVAEIQHAFDVLERIIARGQEAGEFRREIDPRVAGWSLYGALEEILTGWVMGQLPGDEADVARAEQTVVDVFCGGLEPRLS